MPYLLNLQVIREHIDVFKRNGFEFVEAKQHQQQQQQHATNGQQQQQQDVVVELPAEPLNPLDDLTAAASDAAVLAASADPDSSTLPESALAPAAAIPVADCNENDDACDDLLLSSVPLVRGAGAAGVLGEEVLVELLDLIAAGERRPEDLRPKR